MTSVAEVLPQDACELLADLHRAFDGERVRLVEPAELVAVEPSQRPTEGGLRNAFNVA